MFQYYFSSEKEIEMNSNNCSRSVSPGLNKMNHHIRIYIGLNFSYLL